MVPFESMGMVSYTILRWPTNSKSYMIYRTASFQWPWTTPTSGFKVTPFFDAEYLGNDTRHKHSFNGILIWIDLHTPYSTVPFRMTLSDLAKYSMTRNVTRPLCDSWASCFMPLAFDAAVRGSLRNIAMIVWYGKKTRIVGLPDGEKSLRMFSGVDWIPACDRQTDGRTDGIVLRRHSPRCA